MRVIADAVGLQTEDYVSSQVVSSRDVIYEGFVKFLVDDFMIEEFYDKQDIWLYEEDALEQNIILHPNEYILMVSIENEKKTAIGRFINWSTPVKPLARRDDTFSWGISPRNK